MKQEEKVLTEELVKELGLDKLEVITSDMLEGYTSIGACAFLNCTSLTSITIPNSITNIGSYAFEGTTWLNNQPDGVIYINQMLYAYRGEMPENTSIIVRDGTTQICCGAFEQYNNLTSIIIPNSVKNIDIYAFSGCRGLTSIIIPDSVTKIGYSAFSGCSGLASIIIPKSVTSIGKATFYGCNSLTSIIVDSSNPIYDSRNNCNAIIETATNKLVVGCQSTIIPDSVTCIGLYAFRGCNSLNSIIIPNSVTSIERMAFEDCSSLNSIIISNLDINIGFCTFTYCNKLKNTIFDNKIYKSYKIIDGKSKAYKAFNTDMTCRDFQYEEGKTYEINGEPELCSRGFHACLNLKDVFNYYYGILGKDIVIHEVELEGISENTNNEDSKVVAKKITIGKRIL